MSTLQAYAASLEAPTAAIGASEHASAGMQGSFAAALIRAGVRRQALLLILVHLLETGVLLGSWVCIGRGALSGRLDAGWLAAWALTLVCLLPLHALNTWIQGVAAVGFGGVLKQRLLQGALSLSADVVQRRGSAALLSELVESDSLEELLASGSLDAILAAVELAVIGALLVSVSGYAQLAVLCGWMILTAVLFTRALRRRLAWSRQRVKLTQRLVQNMVAHRTRVAQQSAEHWHAADDKALRGYLQASRGLDRIQVAIQTVLPRGYILVALVTMMPSFIAGQASLGDLAVTLGTILFATSSWQRLSGAFSRGAAALAAWEVVAPLFAAGAPSPEGSRARPEGSARHSLDVRDISYQRPGSGDAILQKASFTVAPGERILLEGPSGGGKSTLAAILAGSRAATSGYVLAGGLDRQTLGASQWTRQVALAPQYHENHIVSGTLLFNLLLARPLPHGPSDIEEAEAVCAELGLGELIARMPAGLHQIVGDTGWRLSQGERSRVFLARALLQKAAVIILDESLAALDPENLGQCLECILRRAPSLILIAHP